MGGGNDPERSSQCSFDPKLTLSDPKQLCSLASEISAIVIPGTECFLNNLSVSAVFASSDGLDQIQNCIWILLYLGFGFFFNFLFLNFCSH